MNGGRASRHLFSKKCGRKLQKLVSEVRAYIKFGKAGKQTVKSVNTEVENLIETLLKDEIRERVMVSGMTYRKGENLSKTFSQFNFTKDEIGKLLNGKYLDNIGSPSIFQKFIDEMHPTLKKRYMKHMDEFSKGLKADASDIARAGVPGSHGEIRALDDLLKEIDPHAKLGDDVFEDIIGYNRFLRKGADKIQPPCAHCHFMTDLIQFIGL